MEIEQLRNKTISDFSGQWSVYSENEGWYASLELFKDMIAPLLDAQQLQDMNVADIGSGTGRIISMLLSAGVKHVQAIEPAEGAFQVLQQNIEKMKQTDKVTLINQGGEHWRSDPELDYVFSIGVIHHIPDPKPVIKNAFDALKPGGRLFIWLYGYEGNELYLRAFAPIRKITVKLPHAVLKFFVEIIYGMLFVYKHLPKLERMPLRPYIDKVLWPMTPKNRRLVVYDQLNPAYAKYYKKEEAIQLLEEAGFQGIQIHHRHGYSWSVLGEKPL